MNEDFEQAERDHAIYMNGWQDAKNYYKELMLADEDMESPQSKYIEETFDMYPEDEMEILRRAALSRGQP